MFCDLKFLFYLCKIKQNTAFCLKMYLFYMKDRIKQLMESQHMSQQTFADFIGISSPTLSSIFNGRTKPSIYTVEAIRSKFPTISLDWLMYGNGPMFKDDISSPSQISPLPKKVVLILTLKHQAYLLPLLGQKTGVFHQILFRKLLVLKLNILTNQNVR